MAAFFFEHQQHTNSFKNSHLGPSIGGVFSTSKIMLISSVLKLCQKPDFVCYIPVEMLYNQKFDPQVSVMALVYQKFIEKACEFELPFHCHLMLFSVCDDTD